jgi:hypothetical protein
VHVRRVRDRVHVRVPLPLHVHVRVHVHRVHDRVHVRRDRVPLPLHVRVHVRRVRDPVHVRRDRVHVRVPLHLRVHVRRDRVHVHVHDMSLLSRRLSLLILEIGVGQFLGRQQLQVRPDLVRLLEGVQPGKPPQLHMVQHGEQPEITPFKNTIRSSKKLL